MEMEIDEMGSILWKVGLFLLVQALVYLILSRSSNLFSKIPRSNSFKLCRSLSIQRWAAALADVPSGGDSCPSPMSFFRRSFSRRDS